MLSQQSSDAIFYSLGQYLPIDKTQLTNQLFRIGKQYIKNNTGIGRGMKSTAGGVKTGGRVNKHK